MWSWLLVGYRLRSSRQQATKEDQQPPSINLSFLYFINYISFLSLLVSFLAEHYGRGRPITHNKRKRKKRKKTSLATRKPTTNWLLAFHAQPQSMVVELFALLPRFAWGGVDWFHCIVIHKLIDFISFHQINLFISFHFITQLTIFYLCWFGVGLASFVRSNGCRSSP